MNGESGRTPAISFASPLGRPRREPIRVPIDDVPRGSLVDLEAAHDAAYSVHVSIPPMDGDAAVASVPPPNGVLSIPQEMPVSYSVAPPDYSVPPPSDSSHAELLVIPPAAPVPAEDPQTSSTPPPASAEADDMESSEFESLEVETDGHYVTGEADAVAVHATNALLADAYGLDNVGDGDGDTGSEAGEASIEDASVEASASDDASTDDTSVDEAAVDDGALDDGAELEEMDAADFVEETKSASSRMSIPPAMPPAAAQAAKPPAAPGPPPAPPVVHKKWRNWFETFFNDDYLRTVLQPSARAVAWQCDFIERALGLPPGAHILDVGCGLGHFSNELARRGYTVVAIDSSKTMITRATEDAADYGIEVKYITGDMRDMTFDVSFDAVLCWGTTFGYFDDETNRRVLTRMRDALREGGKLLLDVVNRDFVVRAQPNLVWFEGDGCVCMEETQFNATTSTLEVSRNVMLDEGRQREANYAVRLYALHELARELESLGLRLTQVSGAIATPGVFFGADAQRIIIVAESRGGSNGRTPPPGQISILPGTI